MESVPTLLEIAITNRLRVFFFNIYIVLSSLEMLVYKFFFINIEKEETVCRSYRVLTLLTDEVRIILR